MGSVWRRLTGSDLCPLSFPTSMVETDLCRCRRQAGGYRGLPGDLKVVWTDRGEGLGDANGKQ